MPAPPAVTVDQDSTPDPLVVKTCPVVPPVILTPPTAPKSTTPEPSGANVILPLAPAVIVTELEVVPLFVLSVRLAVADPVVTSPAAVTSPKFTLPVPFGVMAILPLTPVLIVILPVVVPAFVFKTKLTALAVVTNGVRISVTKLGLVPNATTVLDPVVE